MEFNQAYKYLNQHRKTLTNQQYKTFLGQMKSGNIVGMLKGLDKIINKTN